MCGISGSFGFKEEQKFSKHLRDVEPLLKRRGPDQLNIIDCLGFTKGNCCPHYDEESERRPSLIQFLKNKELSDCYAIEGGCALHIKNDDVYSAVSFQGNKKSYLVNLEGERIKENICSTTQIPI